MYNLKRILQQIIDFKGHESTVEKSAKEALIEIEALEAKEKDAPQEMRDVFAAASVIGLSNDPQGDFSTQGLHELARISWVLSDAMMIERAKRIEARKAVQS